jgi:hypothetical protein
MISHAMFLYALPSPKPVNLCLFHLHTYRLTKYNLKVAQQRCVYNEKLETGMRHCVASFGAGVISLITFT